MALVKARGPSEGRVQVFDPEHRLKRIEAQITTCVEKRTLAALNRAWWREYCRLNPKEKYGEED